MSKRQLLLLFHQISRRAKIRRRKKSRCGRGRSSPIGGGRRPRPSPIDTTIGRLGRLELEQPSHKLATIGCELEGDVKRTDTLGRIVRVFDG